MSQSNEKRRQLDDEMSRFEAEISGPPGITPLPPPPPGLKTIIGSKTFNKVQEQLEKTPDNAPLPPPPGPQITPRPGPSLPALPSCPRPPSQPLPPCPGPPSQRLPPPPIPPKIAGPRHDGPRGFGPPGHMNARPFPPPHHSFGHNLGPRPRNGPPGPFGPPGRGIGPHPPPNFMGPQGGNFNNMRPGGPSPSGFIPHQVGRPPCGPIFSGPQGMPTRPPSFVGPPPPPPGFINSGPKSLNFSTISKPPSIISSAPKLYSKDAKETSPEKVSVPSVPTDSPVTAPERKKKKQKVEPVASENNATVALEMAEKVKQTTITTKMPARHPALDDKRKDKKHKKNLRYAGGQVWEDHSLAEWDPDDFRLFAGDLGNDVTDELLNRYFSHYPSFVKAKVVRDKRTNKSKGYGFISFRDSHDYIRSMKEINGKYVGSRPIKLRKSMWKDRSLDVVQKKIKEKQLIGLK